MKRCSIYFAWRLLLAFALVKRLVFPLRVFSTVASEEKRAPRQVLVGRCQEPREQRCRPTYVCPVGAVLRRFAVSAIRCRAAMPAGRCSDSSTSTVCWLISPAPVRLTHVLSALARAHA